MSRTIPVVAVIALSACATGPRRQSLPEFITAGSTAEASAAAPTELAPAVSPPAQEAEAPTPASPFSAGLMLGAGFLVEGGGVLPAQLAVGSLKVAEVRGQALNLLALGGVSQTDVSRARLAWGLGAGFQVTPERYAYEMDAATGVLWFKGEPAPAVVLGFVLTPKM